MASWQGFVRSSAAKKRIEIREGLRILRDTDTDGSLHKALVSALATRDHYVDLEHITDPDTKKLMFVLMELIQDQGRRYWLSDRDAAGVRML